MGVFKRLIKSKKGETPYWYIRYTVNKKLKWESIGKVGEVTKAVADAILAERKKQIRLGTFDLMNTKIPTLNELKDEYVQYKKKCIKKQIMLNLKENLKEYRHKKVYFYIHIVLI